jgi:hypothetical protein
MRNGVERDRVSAELGGVLCFEMEAAGLINSFPCLLEGHYFKPIAQFSCGPVSVLYTCATDG